MVSFPSASIAVCPPPAASLTQPSSAAGHSRPSPSRTEMSSPLLPAGTKAPIPGGKARMSSVLGLRHRDCRGHLSAQVRGAQSPTTVPAEKTPPKAATSPYSPHNFSVSTLLQETEKQALVRWWGCSGRTRSVLNTVARACLEPPVDSLRLPQTRKLKSCTSL